MGDVVDLKPAVLVEDQAFVADLARYRENLLDEKTIRKKYRLAEAAWQAFGEDDELIRKVEEESIRRIRDGSSKREKAQKLVVAAPDVLSGILLDNSANARHRIDSCKVLNEFAANGPQGVPASDRFQIIINLGSDSLRFDKSIEVNPNDVDPCNSSTTLEETAFAVIAMKKPTESGGGDNTL